MRPPEGRRHATREILLLLLAATSAHASDWPNYGRDPGGSRWSPLAQIKAANVAELRVAWTYRTGEAEAAAKTPWHNATFEATPILVDGALYFCSTFTRAIALDAASGRELWRFDPGVDPAQPRSDLACRGVSVWRDSSAPARAACAVRILLGTADGRLISLDARDGKPCTGFGDKGTVDLKRNLHGEPAPGGYALTSPPAVAGDVIVVGSAIADNRRADEVSGAVRGLDARTGAQLWSWDPIPRDANDPARRTWEGESATRTGAANAWSILSADPERGLVFIPTGSASPDFYGGERKGDNRFANSVVALRAATGELVWGFQVVHHDLWDYDVPAQPTLVTVRRDGREIPAVAQATKMGLVFVLHRETGEPLFPVEERPVPQTDVAGEQTSPTQPFPSAPPPLVPLSLKPEDAWGLTPWDRNACGDRIAAFRSEGIYTPPSEQGTIVFPGNAGGTNWGSVAFHPERHLLITNTNRIPTLVRLIPRADFDTVKTANPGKEVSAQAGTPFGLMREFDALLSPLGLPCNPPPWGTLVAVDLDAGSIRWEVPLGTVRDIAPVPLPIRYGVPNMGGPIVTGGGLIFIGAAMDDYLRAFDLDTGAELWKGRLPAGGQATPMTYEVGGRQYVVIAAGGHGRLTTTGGDHVVAYALP
jgi:quinoprotein glucose dehydrogenase